MMQVPNAAELLRAWETGARQPTYMRGATLLAAALPGSPEGELRDWGLGKRDHHLLALRAALFGPQMPCVVECPECTAALEVTLSAASLQTHYLEAECEVKLGDATVVLRAPTTSDLAAVARTKSAGELARRCVVRGDAAPAAVQHALAELDAQADVQLELRCVDCGHEWTSPFDIAGFLWREVDAWANTTLREVHLLARAHGWSESEILSLTPWRRQRYLDLVLQ